MSNSSHPRLQLLDQLVEIALKLRELESDHEKSLEGLQNYKENEELFTNLFEKAKDGILVLQEGTIVLANSRMCQMVETPLEELLGTSGFHYIKPELIRAAIQKFEDWRSGKTPSPFYKTKLLKKGGGEIEVELDAARIAYKGKEASLVIVSDVTFISKAEQELLRLRQYQVSLVEHANIWVDVLDQNGNVVIWNTAAEEISGYSKEDVVGHARIWEYLYPDKAYRNEIFARAMNIIHQGESTQGFETKILTRNGQSKIISWYSRDLLNDSGQSIGSIAIGLDITALKESNEALSRANQALQIAYDETIEGWSRALDLRDKETEGHSQRVTEMTLRLAQLAGMTAEELVNVRRGALLHDIGKLGVSDSILLKPSELSNDEWVQIRKHPQYAYNLLSPIEYLKDAMDIPYCHHEKWDGTGYPRGLKGEQIPLAARLFAVVDIYDAMRSDRPYRKGFNKVQTVESIRLLSGTHLDPQAVEYFLSLADIYK